MHSAQTPVANAVDARRCGGTLWATITRPDWHRFHAGQVVQYPRDSIWTVAPTGMYVAVQAGSVEQMICTCAATGNKSRVQLLLADSRLDRHDIHPAARADAAIWLDDRPALAQALMESSDARTYVFELSNGIVPNPTLVEWAQDYCLVIDARLAASVAAEWAAEIGRINTQVNEFFLKAKQ